MTLVDNIRESVYMLRELSPEFYKKTCNEMNNHGIRSGQDYYQGKGCFFKDFIQGEFTSLEKKVKGEC